MEKLRAGEPRALAILYWSAVNGLCTNQLILGEKFIAPQPRLLDGILLND